MSQRSTFDVIHQMYDFAAREDVEGMLALLTPDFELDVSRNVFNPAVWRGEEGAREWLRQTQEVWQMPTYDVERVVELDDGRTLSVVVLEGRARLSGVNMQIRLWHLWTIRDGLVERCAHFNDEASALRAAGLTDLPPSE